MDTVEFELPEIDWKLAGTRIRAARNYRGMTARKLSELVGISEESLLHLESFPYAASHYGGSCPRSQGAPQRN